HPRRPLFSRMAAPHRGLRLGMFPALRPAHGRPVIFVFRGAQQADLVIVAIATTTRPGKLVRAAPKHKHIHEFLRHVITSGLPNPRMQAHHLSKPSLWIGYFRAPVAPYAFLTTVDASPYPVAGLCPAILNRLLLFM